MLMSETKNDENGKESYVLFPEGKEVLSESQLNYSSALINKQTDISFTLIVFQYISSSFRIL